MVIEDAGALDIFDAAKHHGKGFFYAAFPLAEDVNGGFGPRVAGQVESAEALHGDNCVALKKPSSVTNWLGGVDARSIR